ncbi:MAG: hypothetical protein LBJ70_02545 [Holosporales bacterium]|jgi:O-methyltransferase|nr:hypothetical protein [Holosporales bacterium]
MMGVIFVHDYNSQEFLGVRKAVAKAEELFGPFKKIPLSDPGGTLVIVK